jgi:polar amino acid transport system substrate-binding protein
MCLLLAALLLLAGARAAEPETLRGLDDLTRARIALVAGSSHDEHVARRYPQAQVLQFKATPDVVLAVSTGKADVAFLALESVREIFRTTPNLAILVPEAYRSPMGAAFRPDDTTLRPAYNAFVRGLRENGVYEAMQQRWFKEGARDLPPLPPRGQGPVLRLGITASKGLPWTGVRNGAFTGFEVELAERFAASLGRPLELVDLDVSGQIAALASGRIEAIACLLVMTEERRKRVAFSDELLAFVACVVTREDRIAGAAPAAAAASEAGLPLGERIRANLVDEGRYRLILEGLFVTCVISVLATLFGTVFGGVVCAGRMSSQPLLRQVAAVYIWCLRGVPVLVVLMIIYYVVFASFHVSPILVAAVAFGLNAAAYIAEMLRSAIQSVDRGQLEAGVAGGFTRAQAFRLIVLPQALRQVLPVYKGEVISLFKMTSVVGYIAVQDITKAGDIIRSRTFDAFIPLLVTAAIYLVLAWLIAWALERVELRVTPPHQRQSTGVAP